MCKKLKKSLKALKNIYRYIIKKKVSIYSCHPSTNARLFIFKILYALSEV